MCFESTFKFIKNPAVWKVCKNKLPYCRIFCFPLWNHIFLLLMCRPDKIAYGSHYKSKTNPLGSGEC